MYYKDLTKYEYHTTENSLNIGWLEKGHSINQGSVSDEFLEKLWKYLRYPVRVYRGFHVCDLCKNANELGVPIVKFKGEKRKVGYYEIRVWGEDGTMYAAPSLIFHYILKHGYQPPQEFIDAVTGSADASSVSYYRKILEYSHGDDFWFAEDCTITNEKLIDKIFNILYQLCNILYHKVLKFCMR